MRRAHTALPGDFANIETFALAYCSLCVGAVKYRLPYAASHDVLGHLPDLVGSPTHGRARYDGFGLVSMTSAVTDDVGL